VGERQSPVRNRNADRLVSEVERGEHAAISKQRGNFPDGDDVPWNGGFPLTCGVGVLSFRQAKIEEF
jgi:hypothetical protein